MRPWTKLAVMMAQALSHQDREGINLAIAQRRRSGEETGRLTITAP
jgi:hypothetical protein